MDPAAIRDFYRAYGEDISAKRYCSPWPIRRHAHLSRVNCLIGHLPPGASILEIGCGDGFFAILAASKGWWVTGADLSADNTSRCVDAASRHNLDTRCNFIQADAANLPFADDSFDVVVASHVLEHLPDFDEGVREVRRIARGLAIIALPTPLNLSAMVILGGSNFWEFSLRSFTALPRGAARVLAALARGREGVDEGSYAGQQGVPHIWFFPSRMRRRLLAAGFDRVEYEADALSIPYLGVGVPISRALERWRALPILRASGYGTHFLCYK